ncbi:hypothetical protein B9K06_18700 [Bacillus sp. OG2]|nr:hypothetical protein B9K06_18700 [Bacillus sp. OG2]
MWTLLLICIIILTLLSTGSLNNISLILISLLFLVFGATLEKRLLKKWKKPNKFISILISILFIGLLGYLLYEFIIY